MKATVKFGEVICEIEGEPIEIAQFLEHFKKSLGLEFVYPSVPYRVDFRPTGTSTGTNVNEQQPYIIASNYR